MDSGAGKPHSAVTAAGAAEFDAPRLPAPLRATHHRTPVAMSAQFADGRFLSPWRGSSTGRPHEGYSLVAEQVSTQGTGSLSFRAVQCVGNRRVAAFVVSARAHGLERTSSLARDWARLGRS